MKKGQIIEGVVERVDFPNKGIVNTAEGICTVKNVLPGQKITLMVQKNRNKKAEGRVLSVDQKSPLEIESPVAAPIFHFPMKSSLPSRKPR